jgi:hypothetical protein
MKKVQLFLLVSLLIGTLAVNGGETITHAEDSFTNDPKSSESQSGCYGKNSGAKCWTCSNIFILTEDDNISSETNKEIQTQSDIKQINECVLSGDGNTLAVSGNDVSETSSTTTSSNTRNPDK